MNENDLYKMARHVIRTSPHNVPGYDHDDLMQELVIAGLEAERVYDDSVSDNLGFWIMDKMRYKLLGLIRQSYTNKRKIARERSVSWDACIGDSDTPLSDVIADPTPTLDNEMTMNVLYRQIMSIPHDRNEDIIINLRLDCFTWNKIDAVLGVAHGVARDRIKKFIKRNKLEELING